MLPRGRMDARVKPAHDQKGALPKGVLLYRRGFFVPRLFFCGCRLRAETLVGTGAGACGGRTGRLAAACFLVLLAPP